MFIHIQLSSLHLLFHFIWSRTSAQRMMLSFGWVIISSVYLIFITSCRPTQGFLSNSIFDSSKFIMNINHRHLSPWNHLKIYYLFPSLISIAVINTMAILRNTSLYFSLPRQSPLFKERQGRNSKQAFRGRNQRRTMGEHCLLAYLPTACPTCLSI